MSYAPPLIKPPLPPLRPPVAPPYRPPVLAPPPTQIDPGYEPPTLLPPTDIDLKGIVCIYSNAPIWEGKKIRYRYPGENWKEIAGESYTVTPEFDIVRGGQYFDKWTLVSTKGTVTKEGVKGSSVPNGIFSTFNYSLDVDGSVTFIGTFVSWKYFTNPPHILFTAVIDSAPSIYLTFTITFKNQANQLEETIEFTSWIPTGTRHRGYFRSRAITEMIFKDSKNYIPPLTQKSCTFKVFNIFNQEILSITRDDCPEVIVIPERCYFKAENEKLVRKINISFFQDLKIKYNGNCATVLLESYPLPLPIEIYKECSDNPNCPPPRIRFDKKCEEKCEQCPPGTAIKVLLGSRIACVDAFGCVLKSIKYKPGCNNYDCICS